MAAPTRVGVICAGCACLDLFLLQSEILPTRESLALVGSTAFTPGCATSNTGRALADIGVPVEILSQIGEDVNGDTLLKMWAEFGIGIKHVRRTKDASTSLSVLPVYNDGKRGIYFCFGTNALLDADRLFGPNYKDIGILNSFSLFHFGYPSLLPKLQGEPLAKLFQEVAKTGIFISLDTTSLLDEKKHRDMIDGALHHVGLFHVNLEEAASLTGKIQMLLERAKQRGDHISAEDVVTPHEVEEIGAILLQRGPGMVAISLGCNGAYTATADENTLKHRWGEVARHVNMANWASKRVHLPAFRSTPGSKINATGAGDSYIGGLLASLLHSTTRQQGLKLAMQLGHAAALQRIEEGRKKLKVDEILREIEAHSFTTLSPPNTAFSV